MPIAEAEQALQASPQTLDTYLVERARQLIDDAMKAGASQPTAKAGACSFSEASKDRTSGELEAIRSSELLLVCDVPVRARLLRGTSLLPRRPHP